MVDNEDDLWAEDDVCDTCGGAEELPCPTCDTLGMIFNEETQSEEICDECKGDGYIPCEECQ